MGTNCVIKFMNFHFMPIAVAGDRANALAELPEMVGINDSASNGGGQWTRNGCGRGAVRRRWRGDGNAMVHGGITGTNCFPSSKDLDQSSAANPTNR